MATDIFDSHKEPDELFLPLSSERYCHLYDMELADFHDDLTFYQARIKIPGTVLELGCGSGRLCRQLAATGADITGIDRSSSMLHRAGLRSKPNITYLRMDMTELALSQKFDTVIIAYHTLNLLVTEERITKCLTQIRSVLKEGGRLLLQVFVPDLTIMKLGSKKLFQFQIIEQPEGGKIIKEIRRGITDEKLILEERYRLRPQQPGAANEDLSHTLHLAAFPAEKWRTLLHDSGFSINEQFGDYTLAPFIPGRDTCLFIEATLSSIPLPS